MRLHCLPVVWSTLGIALLAGCGIPGPPQPPSLNLPLPVADLRAQRVGNSVVLEWTDGSQNTDKTPIRTAANAILCVQESLEGECKVVQQVVAPAGVPVTVTVPLSEPLGTGPARLVYFRVSLENARRKSAGRSDPATALAGQAPSNVTGLRATNVSTGVELHWQAGGRAPQADGERLFRIERLRLTQDKAETRAERRGESQILEVPDMSGTGSGGPGLGAVGSDVAGSAVDPSIQRDSRYRYSVQAILRVTLETSHGLQTLEMLGQPSSPVEVETKSVFPPAPPQGLAVVPVWEQGTPAMDLAWEPSIASGVQPEVVGYRVYRIRKLEQRILVSGSDLLTAPAFVDRGLEPGIAYRYAVVAVDSKGNVSSAAESDSVTAMLPDK